jgi:hypothetical protein
MRADEPECHMRLRVTQILLLLVVVSWHQSASADVFTSADATVESLERGNLHRSRVGTLWLGLEGWASRQLEVGELSGITEYELTVSVSNSSGIDWKGYRFWLGFGVAPDYVARASRAGDGLGFHTRGVAGRPLPDSTGTLRLHESSEDALYWSGPFANGTSVDFSFSVDVPSSLKDTQLWMFEQPTAVPEPGTFVLAASGFGLLALARYLRRS